MNKVVIKIKWYNTYRGPRIMFAHNNRALIESVSSFPLKMRSKYTYSCATLLFCVYNIHTVVKLYNQYSTLLFCLVLVKFIIVIFLNKTIS